MAFIRRAFLVGLVILASTGSSKRIKVRVPNEAEQTEKGWLSWFWNDVPECKTVYSTFTPSAIAKSLREIASWANPMKWISFIGNVMDISDEVDDLEELDMKAVNSAPVPLDAAAFVENLKSLETEVVVQIWLRRIKEVGATLHEFVEWLDTQFGGRRETPTPGLLTFLQSLATHVRHGATQKQLNYIKGNVSIQNPVSASLPEHPIATDTFSTVTTVVSDPDENTVGVRGRTSMFDDAYWRNQLLKTIWPHADHIGGYMIRTAMGKVGSEKGKQTIQGQSIEQNKKLMEQNGLYNAYSDKPVVAWEELDGVLMEKLWEEASTMFRELDGVDPDAEYIVAFTFRGMKAGGLLDRSGQGLPGPIWHKDIFANHVTIIYPFCFLAGYDNELASKFEYEKSDPGSKHLAKFTEDVDNTVKVSTVQPGSKQGFGETVTFNNDETRHRALVPLNAARDDIEKARINAKNWGVPDNAIRAMIHITIRKASWTDIVEQVAFRVPNSVGAIFGPIVKCLQQAPWIEQWWFNTHGGFINRTNRLM